MSLNREQQQFLDEQYHKLHKDLLIYANSAVGNKETAEDLVQKAFLAACEEKAIKSFMSSDSPKGWMIKTLKNQIRNYTRSKRRKPDPASYDDDSILFDSALMGKNEEYIKLMYSDLLKEGDWEIIQLVSQYGYTAKEVAEELGISLSACNRRISRAKERLRKVLDDLEKI